MLTENLLRFRTAHHFHDFELLLSGDTLYLVPPRKAITPENSCDSIQWDSTKIFAWADRNAVQLST